MAGATEREWIIKANVIDFIKSILTWPSTEEKHNQVMSSAWDLLFELILDGSNEALIWENFQEILMKHLNQRGCRIVMYCIYARAHLAQTQGMTIFKILIREFFKVKENRPVEEQALTTFLQHFMTNEANISTMYPQLIMVEKRNFLHFIVDCITKPSIDFTIDHCVSSALLRCICNDFIAETEIISPSSFPDYLQAWLLFPLFEAISYASADARHELEKFDFRLLLNVVNLFKYVRTHDDIAERYFRMHRRNAILPMKELLLTTIINLVSGNADHKEKVRQATSVVLIG